MPHMTPQIQYIAKVESNKNIKKWKKPQFFYINFYYAIYSIFY
jgi:hypothetical protein